MVAAHEILKLCHTVSRSLTSTTRHADGLCTVERAGYGAMRANRDVIVGLH